MTHFCLVIDGAVVLSVVGVVGAVVDAAAAMAPVTEAVVVVSLLEWLGWLFAIFWGFPPKEMHCQNCQSYISIHFFF